MSVITSAHCARCGKTVPLEPLDWKHRCRAFTWLDAVLLWVALVGVWPVVGWHAPHTFGTVLGAIDIAAHAAAWLALNARWRIVRRNRR